PRLPRVALRSFDECAVVIGMDGLTTGGVGVAPGAAVNLEGGIQVLGAVQITRSEISIRIGVTLHHSGTSASIQGRSRRPEGVICTHPPGVLMSGDDHFHCPLGKSAEVTHGITIDIFPLDLAWPRHRLITRTWGQQTRLLASPGSRERTPSIASRVMGVLRRGLSACTAGHENAALPIGTSRKHHNAIVIHAGASPAMLVCRRPCRVLASQPK